MKQPINFRLNKKTAFSLKRLAKKLNLTKTEIVERAIGEFYRENNEKGNDLVEYFGVLGQKESKNILEFIKESRRNKDLNFDL